MINKFKKIFGSKIEGIPSYRVVSVDALRGFTMFWIVGGAPIFLAFFGLFDTPLSDSLALQLEHPTWNGFTFWDLIFPMFLFVVGISITYSICKRLERGDSRKDIYIHIIKRTLTLIILGFVYNGLFDFDFANFRYAGVLQRIGICYFFASVILINTSKKLQVIIATLFLIVYWAAMKFIPVPGFGAGVLTPEGNLSAFIDQHLLPGQFCCYGYGDNEGILSTIPAISTTILGVLTGHWLKSSLSKNKKVLGIFLAGIISIILGLLWNLNFPINKLIWTSSYVLFAGGLSLLFLASFYWIIEIKGYQTWAFPFVVIGLNPITIYVLSGVFNFGSIVNIFVHGFIDYLGEYKELFWVLCVFIVKWLFLYFLYKRRIFLKA